jgi:alanyl-tRNA synthetase
MPIEQARKEGAMALFGEKYGDVVRTVKVIETGDKYYSMELCGGTHVQNIGTIGMFKIISESSVGSGIRRIEAVCGSACEKYVDSLENKIDEVSEILKTSKVALISSAKKVMADIKILEEEIAKLKSKVISGEIDEYIKSAKVIDGVNVIAFSVKDIDVKSLREMADRVKTKQPSAIIVIASQFNDKISFVVSVSKELIEKGYNSGKIAKQFASKIEGSGGGKPDFAQGGGKKVDNLQSVFDNISEILK